MSTDDSEIVRYHTAGRRQPQLIGKDPSGVPIWGGPYTLYQVAGLLTIPVMWQTRILWAGELSGIAVIAVIGMTTVAITWLLGRIDFSGRNIIYAAAALLAAWAKTLRPGPRPPRRHPGTHVTGLAVHARTPTPCPDDFHTHDDDASPAADRAVSTVNTPDSGELSVQPDVATQAGDQVVTDVPAGQRLSPLESFLAAADKVKVPCP